MKLGLIFTVAVMFVGCDTQRPPDVPVIEYDGGGGDPNTKEFPMCELACANLARLGCPEARTPDGGLPCYDVCAKAEKSQRFTLRPKCVAGASDRDAVRDCRTVTCRVE